MKYNDNGTKKEISVKASDTFPIGGTTTIPDDMPVPDGWEEVEDLIEGDITIPDGYTAEVAKYFIKNGICYYYLSTSSSSTKKVANDELIGSGLPIPKIRHQVPAIIFLGTNSFVGTRVYAKNGNLYLWYTGQTINSGCPITVSGSYPIADEEV